MLIIIVVSYLMNRTKTSKEWNLYYLFKDDQNVEKYKVQSLWNPPVKKYSVSIYFYPKLQIRIRKTLKYSHWDVATNKPCIRNRIGILLTFQWKNTVCCLTRIDYALSFAFSMESSESKVSVTENHNHLIFNTYVRLGQLTGICWALCF